MPSAERMIARRTRRTTRRAPGKAPSRWTVARVLRLFALPFPDLVFRAQQVHRAHHAPNTVQLSRLISIKTGGCPEDCGYCPQAKRYHTGVAEAPLLDVDTVVAAARRAKDEGATRFCMGAAWRGPKDRDLAPVLDMVREVKALGLEACCTLGMLKDGQAEALKAAGLDYYNHNLDTAPEFYGEVITTRGYQDRLDTLERVRAAGIGVCCGGIVGMGETRAQRAGLIAQLAAMDPYPESVPINHLVQVAGTPLHGAFGGETRARSVRVRAHDRGRAHHDAEGDGAAVGRPARAGGGDPGAVLSRRSQLDLPRRQAPDDGQPRCRRRPLAPRQAGADARVVTPGLIAALERDLAALDAAGLKRSRRTLESAPGARVVVDGRQLVAFASNDYLGLANHPDVVAAARDGAARWGAGAAASHLVCGHFAPHAALEAELAAFVRPCAEARALTFSSGYLANLAILTALAGRSDAVFADRLNHACLNDGALLSRAEFVRYPHGDVAALSRRLAASKAKRKLIATDAVFSMDGDIAPLPALLALAEEHDAWLVVDDAHGFGVLGEGEQGGRGTLAHFGLASERIVYMGTLGKAAGVAGAFVAAHRAVIETLLATARSYVFTTAAPPLLAEALRASLRILAHDHARRAHLARAHRPLSRPHARGPVDAASVDDADPAGRGRRQCDGDGARRGALGSRVLGAGDPSADRAGRHRAASRHADGGAFARRHRRARRRVRRPRACVRARASDAR